MIIELSRRTSNPICITGEFSIQDAGLSWKSMELPLAFDGQEDVPDKTCFPAGTFKVERQWSEKHERMMPHIIVPHVYGVPDRTALEIHSASRPCELLGCVAIARVLINPNPGSPDDVVINQSMVAFYDEFEPLFDAAIANSETVSIAITNDF